MPSERQQSGRYGGLKSWANTVDRSARTEPARSASPGSVDYWVGKLDKKRFADATEAQKLAAAEAAKRAHFAELAMRSAKVRSKNTDQNK